MKSTRQKGKLIAWQDDRGFGFIKSPNGGKEVFLHISTLQTGSRRPKVGDIIYYDLIVNQKGKLRAKNSSIEEVVLQSTNKKIYYFSIVFLASLLPIYGAIDFLVKTGNPIAILLYTVMSPLTFILYADDKSRAVKGTRRVSEKTLHTFELFGGWIGAGIAQQMLRHKSSKKSYQMNFWFIVSFHLLAWVAWFSSR
jgi:uncharacterized membrane protein YsdA (DUF1294 family)/cold shock CspA family protein